MRTAGRLLILAGWFLSSLAVAGCFNPFSMGFATPIPVQPWVYERIQEKYENKNDWRTPIMPPIPPGQRPLCEDQPDRAEILRALPRVCRGVPYFYEEHRDDIDFAIEKVADVIDPPRFYPLIGPAQLHHCHWKCTVFYTETVQSEYPFSTRVRRRRVQVVYIDKDHLHLVAPNADAALEMTKDLVGTRP